MGRGDTEGTLMRKEGAVEDGREGMRLSRNGESKTGVGICGTKAFGRENEALWVRRLHRNLLLCCAGLCLWSSQGRDFK